MTAMAALEGIGLAKRYGSGRWALQEIDVAVTSHAITGLVGPNAAGKSTLLKLWVGFESATKGTAIVAGVDVGKDRSRALLKLGYVPQLPALYRELTVAQHLDLARRLRPGFDRAYAGSRLDDLAVPLESPASELSGGQIAQVSLALALGTRAPILLLDEPLASLDPLARHEFLDVLRDACVSDGLTAILSSHVIGDV